MLAAIDKVGRAWFVRCHGEGMAHQYDVFRCEGCRGLVTHRLIKGGGCPKCLQGTRMRPAVLTVREKLRLLFAWWTV